MKQRVALLIALGCITITGCYNYQVVRCEAGASVDACRQSWDPATEWETKTMHAVLWGLVRKPEFLATTVCPRGSAIDQVQLDDNLGYNLITVATLGMWSPKQVKYKCAKRAEGIEPTEE